MIKLPTLPLQPVPGETDAQRKFRKLINFPLIYGSSPAVILNSHRRMGKATAFNMVRSAAAQLSAGSMGQKELVRASLHLKAELKRLRSDLRLSICQVRKNPVSQSYVVRIKTEGKAIRELDIPYVAVIQYLATREASHIRRSLVKLALIRVQQQFPLERAAT